MKNFITLMKDRYVKSITVDNYKQHMKKSSYSSASPSDRNNNAICLYSDLKYFLNTPEINTENDYYNNIEFFIRYYKDLIKTISRLGKELHDTDFHFDSIYGLADNISKGGVFIAPKSFKFLTEDISDIVANILKTGIKNYNEKYTKWNTLNSSLIENIIGADLVRKINTTSVLGFDVYINSILKEQERNDSIKLEVSTLTLQNKDRIINMPIIYENVKHYVSVEDEVYILVKHLTSSQFIKILFMLQATAITLYMNLLED